MQFLLFFVALPAFAGILFWVALRKPLRIQWELLLAGLFILAVVCALVGFVAQSGDLGGAIAFLLGVIASVTALCTGLLLAILLPLRHKVFAGLIGLVFPVAMLLTFQTANEHSPESIVKENGKAIVQALTRYHADHGRYPETLDQLVPKYLADLNEPQSDWGWLYLPSGGEFSFGWVTGVDAWAGYSIYIYQSSSSEWKRLDSSGPFNLGPTPISPATKYSHK